jgi:hypothetical protein
MLPNTPVGWACDSALIVWLTWWIVRLYIQDRLIKAATSPDLPGDPESERPLPSRREKSFGRGPKLVLGKESKPVKVRSKS